MVGIETDRGPWVAVLVSAGYTALPVNPPKAFEDRDAADTLELLGKAPDPARAARLTRTQVRSARRSSAPAAGTSRTGPLRSWPRCA